MYGIATIVPIILLLYKSSTFLHVLEMAVMSKKLEKKTALEAERIAKRERGYIYLLLFCYLLSYFYYYRFCNCFMVLWCCRLS